MNHSNYDSVNFFENNNYYTPSKHIMMQAIHSVPLAAPWPSIMHAMMSSQRNRWAGLLLHPGRYAEFGSGKNVKS